MKNGLIIILLLLTVAGLYYKEDNNSSAIVIIKSSHVLPGNKDFKRNVKTPTYSDEYSNVAVNNTTETDNTVIADHDKESQQPHIPKEIKTKLCLSDSLKKRCVINLAVDFVREIFDVDSGHLKLDEITTIITSANYNEVLEELSLSKKSEELYRKQSDYNLELSNVISEISELSSSGLFCNEQACGASIQYQNIESAEAFKKRFFQKKNGKGNLFIVHVPQTDHQDAEMRLFFLPGITAPIDSRKE